ncbi:MAG: MerR family DNA-binding transcriptional regulator [Acidimicrobiia bacterium]|nr:MerR family DNA-binding transcriptional regulator [Acidimicrobiia bacterium]
MPDAGPLSIGEVINLLKDDFPEISVSKVRFLENQGLIAPTRSASGYRQFFEEDLERLGFILEQQRDHFLPLKVIKSRLADWEHGITSWDDDETPTAEFFSEDEPVTEDELVRRSGLSSAEVAELEGHGVLRRTKGGLFGPDALAVARQSRLLLDLGLESRHIRTLRLTADRQADLVQQLIAPLMRTASPEAHQNVADRMAILARAFATTTMHLLREELATILDR